MADVALHAVYSAPALIVVAGHVAKTGSVPLLLAAAQAVLA